MGAWAQMKKGKRVLWHRGGKNLEIRDADRGG